MTRLIKGFFVSFGTKRDSGGNDFSEFFSKPAVDKAKVIRRVLREANEERRKVMREYKKKSV